MATRNTADWSQWRGSVTEALKDIRQRQEEHKAALDSFGARFEAALKEHVKASIDRTAALDRRVSKLERAYSRLAVYAVIGAAAVSAFVHKLIG
jgi:hypothetical protein